MAAAREVVLTGCLGGVGLGLDDQNRVTMLRPGGPAAASGQLALGDRILSADALPLEGRAASCPGPPPLLEGLRGSDRELLVTTP